jgi:hypothetical protein
MATKAIVQLHERTTSVALEADLQLRELGVDPQTNSLTVRSELDSTYFHILTKEHTAPTFDSLLILSSTTASRLLATNSSKGLVSVSDLTSWVAGTTNQITLANDGDGSITISIPNSFTLPSASPTFTGLTLSGNGLIGGNATVGGTLGVTGEIESNTRLRVDVPNNSAGGFQIYDDATGNYHTYFDMGRDHNSSEMVFRLRTLGTPVTALTLYGSGAAVFGSSATVSNNLIISTLASGRIPVVSTAGLIIQGHFYADNSNSRLGVGSGASSPASIADFTESNSETSTIRLVNSNSAATGGALLLLSANGASGGDAYINFNINGVTNWAVGADNTDNDAFVLSEASSLGSSNRVRVSSTQFRTYGNLQVDGTTTLTGAVTSNSASTGTSSAFVASSTQPTITLVETDAGTDEKVWDLTASGGVLMLRTRTDSHGAGVTLLSIPRTAPPGDNANTFSFGAPLKANDTLRAMAAVTHESVVTAAAGGTNWTNETSISVSGKNVVEITPTADNQTYKFSGEGSRQTLILINKSPSYSAYMSTSGDGATAAYAYAGKTSVWHFDGSVWWPGN